MDGCGVTGGLTGVALEGEESLEEAVPLVWSGVFPWFFFLVCGDLALLEDFEASIMCPKIMGTCRCFDVYCGVFRRKCAIH